MKIFLSIDSNNVKVGNNDTLLLMHCVSYCYHTIIIWMMDQQYHIIMFIKFQLSLITIISINYPRLLTLHAMK